MKVKRLLLIIFVILFVWFGFQGLRKSMTNSNNKEEVRAVWISYIELSSILDSRSEADFVQQVDGMMANLTAMHFNTIYVHASAFTDSFYPSEYYPYSEYVAGKIGTGVSYDPFEVIVRQAKKYNLKIEAWINPMRSFRTNQEKDIPANSIIGQWLNDSEKRGTRIVEHQDRWYLNPYYPEVRELICNVAKEIVGTYDIQGFHMDDYFYPDGVTDNFDQKAFQEYKQKGNASSLAEFRKENINQMIKQIYATIKDTKDTVQVGISPAGNIEYTTNSIYGDVEEWCSKAGYLDYIAPQIYFGFDHATLPFDECLKQWQQLTEKSNVDLIVGLAAYKINTVDNYAKDGKYEWQQSEDILKRQVQLIQENQEVCGYAIFSYNSLFKPKAEDASLVSKQVEYLQEIMR